MIRGSLCSLCPVCSILGPIPVSSLLRPVRSLGPIRSMSSMVLVVGLVYHRRNMIEIPPISPLRLHLVIALLRENAGPLETDSALADFPYRVPFLALKTSNLVTRCGQLSLSAPHSETLLS